MLKLATRRFRALLFLLGSLAPGIFAAPQTAEPAAKPGAFVLTSVDLYQPESVLQQRLGTNAAPLADYVRRLEGIARQVLAAEPQQRGVTGSLVVAVKPGARSRVWIVLGKNVLTAPLQRNLARALEAAPAVTVQGGPIAFAMNFDAWSGGTPILAPGETVAIPDAWKRAMRGMPPGVVPDAPLQAVWP